MKTFGDSYLLIIADSNKFRKKFSSTHTRHSTEEHLVPLSKSFDFFKKTAELDNYEMSGSSKYTSNKGTGFGAAEGKALCFSAIINK